MPPLTALLFAVSSIAASDTSTVLQAWAYVNLSDTPQKLVSTDGTPLSQSASGDGSSAFARAGTTSIGAGAQSADSNLTEGATGVAAATSVFHVTSRSGQSKPVPLTFNLGVEGSIHASSSPILGDTDVSVASVDIRSSVDRTERNGSILLGSQKGILVLDLTSGAFGADGAPRGQTHWSVNVRLAKIGLPSWTWELLPEYGTFAGVAVNVYQALSTIHQVVDTIAGKAKTEGFPQLGILPGAVVPVWQATFGVDNVFPLTASFIPNDGRPHTMNLSIIVQASSSPVAQSASDY